MAALYRKMGQSEQARERLDQAGEIAQNTASVFLEKLRLLASEGKYDQIVNNTSARIAQRPDETFILLTAGALLVSSGQDEYLRQGRILFQQAAAKNVSSIPAHLGVAQTAYMLGEFDLTEQAYRRILEIDPANSRGLNDLAWLLASAFGDDRLAEADALASKGLKRFPGDPHLLDTHGVILTKMGRFDEARRKLERCISVSSEVHSTQAKALVHLATVLKALKADPATIRSRIEAARSIDEKHHVLSDAERAQLADLLGSN